MRDMGYNPTQFNEDCLLVPFISPLTVEARMDYISRPYRIIMQRQADIDANFHKLVVISGLPIDEVQTRVQAYRDATGAGIESAIWICTQLATAGVEDWHNPDADWPESLWHRDWHDMIASLTDGDDQT